MNAGLGHLKWREPHAGRPARTVFRGIRPAGAHPTRGTEKLIEYKTYLQALPYFDRSEGDREYDQDLEGVRAAITQEQQERDNAWVLVAEAHKET